MVKRHNRLLVAFHVFTDATLAMLAFVLAYLLRFETGLIAITPESAWTWDERRNPATDALRSSGGALPLEPTAPRVA